MTTGRFIACAVGVQYTVAGLYYLSKGDYGMALIYIPYACSMIGLYMVG